MSKEKETKVCGKCEEEKSLTNFYNHRLSPDGKQTTCKVCMNKQTRKYYGENKEKVDYKSRAANLKRLYGISLDQYNEMLKKQHGCCAICDRHRDEFDRHFSVDHNHVTGEIRGLLCTYCNHRVVGRHRDGALLRKVADYIEQGTGLFVPEKKKRARKRKSSSSKD